MKRTDKYSKVQYWIPELDVSLNDCYVADSRGFNNSVRRRRIHPETGKRFTTYEISLKELEKLLEVKELYSKQVKNGGEILKQMEKLKALL